MDLAAGLEGDGAIAVKRQGRPDEGPRIYVFQMTAGTFQVPLEF